MTFRNGTCGNKPESVFCARMDLIEYRSRVGHGAVKDLFTRAGLPTWLVSHVINGHKKVSLEKAKKLVAVCPELDVIALMEMRDRALVLRKQRNAKAARRAAKKSKTKKKGAGRQADSEVA